MDRKKKKLEVLVVEKYLSCRCVHDYLTAALQTVALAGHVDEPGQVLDTGAALFVYDQLQMFARIGTAW
ncbi:hypothetical protein [Methanocella arvoryzae]|uniref:hypothetical protein n=1 Tax=Methanocella arvoryzae TaxID=1175445 RepID=UPI00064EB922|nr:hypothetical protein [Methanocella arvoryzae]